MVEEVPNLDRSRATLLGQIREVVEWNAFCSRLPGAAKQVLATATRDQILWEGAILVAALKSVYGA